MALIPLGSGRFADDPDTRLGVNAMRHQNSVFHGLLKHLPWDEFDRLAAAHRADSRVRQLTTKSQLVALLYSQLAGAASLRDVVTGLQSHAVRLYHIGARLPRRSLDAGRCQRAAAERGNMVHDQPDLWNKRAILITYDEGGGYYDTGYIQPVDFFGDGTRIPVIAVSPYAKKGFVDHTYYDHASVLKFIEWNWGVSKLSSRSRNNLSNPTQPVGIYVPINGPAIGDLRNLFNFAKLRPNAPAITPIITDQDKDD